MTVWLLVSIIVAVVVLFIIFLCVVNARKKFSQIRDILKPVHTQSGVSVCDIWNNQKCTFEFDEVSLREGKSYSYYPSLKLVVIEEQTFCSNSLFDVTAVAHEMGHAYAHQCGSRAMGLWYALSFFERLVCWSILPLFLAGIIMSFFSGVVSSIGTLLLNLSTLFTVMVLINRVVTIPAEQEASKYGLKFLLESNCLSENEFKMSKKMLNVALATYAFAFYERLFANFFIIKKIGQHLFYKNKKSSPKISAKQLEEERQKQELIAMINRDNMLNQQPVNHLVSPMSHPKKEEGENIIRRPLLDDEK